MRVAIAHDWLTGMRGGERVLEALLDLYPHAEIYTLLHVPGSVSPHIESRPIHTSFIQRLPRAASHYRGYLPLFPAAAERFDLRGYDLVLSSSHCVAKGVRPPPGTPHLCYCHTPMRYVWDLYDAYFGPGRAAPWVRAAMPALARRLRRWDTATTVRVTRFVANSRHIRDRIRRCYGRDAAVVHPPVAVEWFRAAARRDDFYLIVSALVPYKRIDVAVEAFNRLDRRLVIVGGGPELSRLRAAARGNITFTGRVDDAAVADWMGRCRAFLSIAEEDFGITAVEAQAAGAPVIAYGVGGARETVVGVEDRIAAGGGAAGGGTAGGGAAPATGLFFDHQTPDALADAVRRFETLTFDPAALRANALRFDTDSFKRGLRAQVDALLAGHAPEPGRGVAEGAGDPQS